ncbi:MAG: hypothetical protein HDT25_11200 [Ruminococcus sp.]|nr:hypothetical protein [Ruminococcus sp.]
MENKSKKIKKANLIHSIAFKTLQFDRALRYSLSLFISGLIFLFVSFNIISEPIKSTLQIFACLSITLCIYLLPFFDTDKIDKFISKFICYTILSILFIVYTIFWFAFCNIDTATEDFFIIIIFIMSLIEIVSIVIVINNILKPIMYIISQISTILKKRAEENKERTFITYLKTVCANLSVIISFILTLITFVVTICNHVDPLEWINKIIT